VNDVSVSVPGNFRDGVYYDVMVVVDGLIVQVLVNGVQRLERQYEPRWIDGSPCGLNMGLVGIGSDNSRGMFDNFVVQALPPQATLDETEDFSDGVADRFTGERAGTWEVTGGR